MNRTFIEVSSSLCNSKRGLYKSGFAVGWEPTIWERRLYFQMAGEFGGQSGQTRGWLVQGERGVNVEAALMAIFRFLEHRVAFISIVVSFNVITSRMTQSEPEFRQKPQGLLSILSRGSCKIWALICVSKAGPLSFDNETLQQRHH